MTSKRDKLKGFNKEILGTPQLNNNNNNIQDNITIYPELKDLIPKLLPDETHLLEMNILSEGCRDALVVWNNKGEYVLIDGHNRYEICKRNKLEFKVEVKEFTNIEDVKDWMIDNQMGKRNLSEEQKSYLRGLHYKREKGKLGENQYTKKSGGDNLSPASRTRDLIGEQYKVSGKTIQRDEKFAEAIDKLTGNDISLKWQILSKQVKIPKSSILKVLDMNEKQISDARKNIDSKSKLTLDNKPAKNHDNYSSEINLIHTKVKSMVKNNDENDYKKAKSTLESLAQKLFGKS